MSVDTRALVILNRVLVHLVLAGRFAEAVDVIDLMDALWGATRGRRRCRIATCPSTMDADESGSFPTFARAILEEAR